MTLYTNYFIVESPEVNNTCFPLLMSIYVIKVIIYSLVTHQALLVDPYALCSFSWVALGSLGLLQIGRLIFFQNFSQWF